MTNDDYRHFVCIVASEEPLNVVDKYDKRKHNEKRLVYRYDDREKLLQNFIMMYDAMYRSADTNEEEKKEIKKRIEYLMDETPDDFYDEMCEENGYEIDEETGDAYTHKNKDGKFSSIELGKFFSIPFKLKDGTEAFQARKGDIDWSKMHLYNQKVYEAAWDMVMEGKEPTNDNEQIIYDNMKHRTTYFQKYGDRENYVLSNTAFWGYAFVSDDVEWCQLEDNEDQFEWVKAYYDRFIAPLSDDTKLTIMECTA